MINISSDYKITEGEVEVKRIKSVDLELNFPSDIYDESSQFNKFMSNPKKYVEEELRFWEAKGIKLRSIKIPVELIYGVKIYFGTNENEEKK